MNEADSLLDTNHHNNEREESILTNRRLIITQIKEGIRDHAQETAAMLSKCHDEMNVLNEKLEWHNDLLKIDLKRLAVARSLHESGTVNMCPDVALLPAAAQLSSSSDADDARLVCDTTTKHSFLHTKRISQSLEESKLNIIFHNEKNEISDKKRSSSNRSSEYHDEDSFAYISSRTRSRTPERTTSSCDNISSSQDIDKNSKLIFKNKRRITLSDSEHEDSSSENEL